MKNIKPIARSSNDLIKAAEIEQIESPLIAQLEVTWSCNHKCKFCYNYWRRDDHKTTDPDINDIKILIDKIYTAGVFDLVITGGEPCLRNDLCDILQYASKKFDRISLNTNGTLLNENIAKTMRECGISGLVSFHAPNSEIYKKLTYNGDFENLLEGLRLLKQNNISFATEFVATKFNLPYLSDTIKLAKNFGSSQFLIARFCEPNDIPLKDILNMQLNHKDIKSLIKIVSTATKELKIPISTNTAIPLCTTGIIPPEVQICGCSAGTTMVAISPNGDIRPCPQFNISMGNVLEKSIKEIWSNNFRDYRKNITPRECEDCPLRSMCSMGCRASALYSNGSYNSVDPLYIKKKKSCLERMKSEITAKREKAIKSIKANISTIPKKKIYEKFEKTPFLFNRKTKIRDEKGGKLLYLGSILKWVNNTAFEIITSIKNANGISPLEIARKMSAKYEVDLKTVLNDVLAIISNVFPVVISKKFEKGK